jgi:hypothetical protein
MGCLVGWLINIIKIKGVVMKYKAVLFAPDGVDHVSDFSRNTIQEVEAELNDMGSRWFFYPIACIVTDDSRVLCQKRILSVNDNFNEFAGKTIKTFVRWIKNNQDEIAFYFAM